MTLPRRDGITETQKEMEMIKPTIGRVVLVKGRVCPSCDGTETEAALVAYVHDDRLINVGGFDSCGRPFGLTSIPLLQDDDAAPVGGAYAEWMPYQKGQAAKTEAMESAQVALEQTKG